MAEALVRWLVQTARLSPLDAIQCASQLLAADAALTPETLAESGYAGVKKPWRTKIAKALKAPKRAPAAAESPSKRRRTDQGLPVEPVEPATLDEARGVVVTTNRSPVMACWAAVVLERGQGLAHEEALSVAHAYMALNARAKGEHLGIYSPTEENGSAGASDSGPEQGTVALMGRLVPVALTAEGRRGLVGSELITAARADRYLRRGLGVKTFRLVWAAMAALAAALPEEELRHAAFAYYEQFRPSVPAGKMGWGVKGRLELDVVLGLVPAGGSAVGAGSAGSGSAGGSAGAGSAGGEAGAAADGNENNS